MLKSKEKEVGQRNAESRVLFAEFENAQSTSYRISFQTTGIVQARSEVSIVPQISGNVVRVNDAFFEGGTFEAGDILFEIEPIDFELQINQLRSAVAQAQTAYNIEQAEAEAAIAEWQQINPSRPAPALVARQPQKAEALANLKSARAQLQNAQLDLKRTKFSLPFSGRVLSANLEQGQFVSAGQSYGSAYSYDNLEVQASLKDQQLEWLLSSEDPEIMISYDYLGAQRSFKGEVKRGVSALNAQTRFSTVNFGFQEKTADIIPGIFVNIDVKGPKLDNVFVLPVLALQKGNSIWEISDEDTLQKTEANIVFSNDAFVIVRNLRNGARIVTSKMPGAAEGMDVKTDDTASSAEKLLGQPPKNESVIDE